MTVATANILLSSMASNRSIPTKAHKAMGVKRLPRLSPAHNMSQTMAGKRSEHTPLAHSTLASEETPQWAARCQAQAASLELPSPQQHTEGIPNQMSSSLPRMAPLNPNMAAGSRASPVWEATRLPSRTTLLPEPQALPERASVASLLGSSRCKLDPERNSHSNFRRRQGPAH